MLLFKIFKAYVRRLIRWFLERFLDSEEDWDFFLIMYYTLIEMAKNVISKIFCNY